MKTALFLPALFFAFFCQAQQVASERKRVLVLTDIENEPDDTQSMVRFLTYSNHWDVEGIVATTSIHQRERIAPESIRKIVNAYDKVRSNLLLHEKGYPETAYLLSIIKSGFPKCGMEAVGASKDSEGSEWIISQVDKADPRPLWIPVWGGANCLAQALWKVKMTRSPEAVEKFAAKLRVYTVSDQDDSGPWIRKNFPNLFYIASPGFHANGAYHYSTWSGISGDKFHGRFSGGNFSIVDNPWLEQHIRKNHGPLGEEYPAVKFLMEGDTPTFLYLINNGLGDTEHPEYGSWGGRYEFYTPRTQKWFYEPETRPLWADAVDEVMGIDSVYHTGNQATIWRWREAYQNDFAARMDWCVKSYKEANHPPVAKLAHTNTIQVKSDEKVNLSAKGSTDPDGNALRYDWMYYAEPSTYGNKNGIQIRDKTKDQAWFTAPKVTKPETIHVVLTVTDNGIPALTRYQRVIVTVMPTL